jgi:hypothetical protein
MTAPQPKQNSPIPETPHASSAFGRAAWLAFGLCLLSATAWVVAHAYLVDQVTVRLCAKADENLPVEKRLPVFLDPMAFDGYLWNRFAEDVGKQGAWRLRHTDFDNPPEGRAVHWNSAFAWYLRGLGELRHALTGEPLRHSIFRMSIWANPILLVLALVLFTPVLARRFGPLFGSIVVIGMLTFDSFYEGFFPAYPDHHGLISFTILGMVMGILWAGGGWVQEEGPGGDGMAARSMAEAKKGMILSALFGAAGLWISAISMALVLGSVGLAASLAILGLVRPPNKTQNPPRFEPGLWKTWGLWGAAGSLFFYLLEYFPSHLGLRLEVNHPLYALTWLAGAWMIYEFGNWARQPSSKAIPFPWSKFLWPLAVCSLLPMLVLFGDGGIYSPKDPFLWRLHKHIVELLPVFLRAEMQGVSAFRFLGWQSLLIPLSLFLMVIPRLGRATQAALLFAAIPALIMTALMFYQTRWGLLVSPLYIALAGILLSQLGRIGPRHPAARIASFFLLAALGASAVVSGFHQVIQPVWNQYRHPNDIPAYEAQTRALVHRQIARSILDSAEGRPVRLLSSPNSSCILACLGGFQTVGTLYWENTTGLKAAAAGLNAQSEEEALAFMKAHQITHMALMHWENFVGPFFSILHPKPRPGISLEKSFAKRVIVDKTIPPWMRPLIYPPNDYTESLNENILLLQFAPGQDLNEARFHLGRYLRLVLKNDREAESLFKQILRDDPQSNLTQLELSSLYFSQARYEDAVTEALGAVRGTDAAISNPILLDLEKSLKAKGKSALAQKVRSSLQ